MSVSLPLAPQYIPDVMKQALEATEIQRGQASIAATNLQMQQDKANFLRNALASTIMKSDSTPDDARAALTQAAGLLGDPVTNRMALAMAGNLPQPTGDATKDAKAWNGVKAMTNAAMMDPNTRAKYGTPQAVDINTGANQLYGATRDPLSGQLLSGPSSYVPNQASPEAQLQRGPGAPNSVGAPTTLPLAQQPGVPSTLVGSPGMVYTGNGAPPPGMTTEAPGGAGTAPTATPNTVSSKDWANAQGDIESGMQAHAKNPNSTAAGVHQFNESTFVDRMKKDYPTNVQGMSDTQIASLRYDPKWSSEVAQDYASKNAATLAQAGFRPTADVVSLAHLAGPTGAESILRNPNLPVSEFLSSEAVKANGLQGVTGAQLLTKIQSNLNGRLAPGWQGKPLDFSAWQGSPGAPPAAQGGAPVAQAAPAAPAAAVRPGGNSQVIGLPPGAEQAINASTTAYNSALQDTRTYKQNVFPMEQAYKALSSDTPSTGRGSQPLYRASAVIRSLTPPMIADLIPFIMTEPQITNREEANKYLQGLIIQNKNKSVEELNTREAANPTVDISPAAAKTVLGAQIAMARMNQALTQQFMRENPDQNTAGAQYNAWMAQHAPKVDPHAFATDLDNKNAHEYYKGLSPTQKSQFQASHELGVTTGVIGE